MNNMTEEKMGEMRFETYIYELLGKSFYLIVIENIGEKVQYNLWKNFIDDLNERKITFEEASKKLIIQFIRTKIDSFNAIFSSKTDDEVWSYYIRFPSSFYDRKELPRIEVLYKALIREANIDSILED